MFLNIIREILQGKSLIRSLMNLELRKYKIQGNILDIGGGKNPSYYSFLQKTDDVKINNMDGKNMDIDFETDKLPIDNDSIDSVLMFNILEHIYNHKFLVQEAYRVTKADGMLLGFVPFLVNYHPDPQDYFRYTTKALNKILAQASYKEIDVKEIVGGQIYVNYNNLMFAWPKIIRVIIFPWYYILDKILVKLKPQVKKRYPLGYLFIARK